MKKENDQEQYVEFLLELKAMVDAGTIFPEFKFWKTNFDGENDFTFSINGTRYTFDIIGRANYNYEIEFYKGFSDNSFDPLEAKLPPKFMDFVLRNINHINEHK